jgi:Zn-dependent protease with chaperone function
MPAPTFRLVFQGKIAPEQDLAEVKGRLQKLFKKDAATIEKMFSGKKVALKQGLNEAQASLYKDKMLSVGVLCEVESQSSKPKATVVAPVKATQSPPGAVNSKPTGTQTSNTTESSKPLKLADIDKAFAGTIPKVDLPATYKAGVMAVGITMVLLPLIYIGLIAMLGYGVLSHVVANTGWMQSLGYKFGVVAYITPIIVGATVIVFMIKPLFARPVVAAKTIVLDPLKEPIFFHFVNKIALTVGAPRPKQIEIDCEVNASASFRKGIFSFFGNDLVLTIGLPLLAGFNSRQLAGVLAHEFGHFSQGVGMRFHYLTYKVNSWFFNAVYLRDSWDAKLDDAAEEADGWLSIILNFARGGVWLTRKVLYAFMMAGHAVSSYMLRQMEFDADRYEAQMAGSQQFKDTTLRLQRLGVAFQVSHDQLAQAWEDKKLVDNLPRLIAHNAQQLPEELDHAILTQIQENRTQVYDSHPSDNERIDNAMAQQAKGIFELDRESRDLLKSFDSLAKQISNQYYANELGLEFDRNKLIDVNQVIQITQENEKQQEAYHEYFKDMAPIFELPISVNIFDTSKTDWDDLLVQYRSVNDQIVDQIGQRRKLMLQANDSYEKYQVLTTIDVLRESGFVLFPQWFGMNEQVFSKYKENIPKIEQSWQQSMEQLKGMFELNDQRLSIALTLLNHPRLIDTNADHANHLKTRNRLSLLINNVKRNAEHISYFEFKHFKLASLVSCAPLMGQKPDEMPEVMKSLLEDVRQAYDQLKEAMGRLDYPFVAEGEHLTIADYIEEFLPQRNHCANEIEFYINCGQIILEKLEAIYARIISGLANIALTVDQLIPSINGEQQVSEQLEQQPNMLAGTAVNAQSNLAYKQTDEMPVPPSSNNNIEVTPVSEPVSKAVFAVDEVTEDREEKDGKQEATSPVAEPSSVVDTQTNSVAAVGESSAQEELSKQEVTLNETPSSGDATKESASTSESGAKAVFAIDESNESEDEASKQEPATPVVESGTKAVFAIDEPTGTDTQVDDVKQDKAPAASEAMLNEPQAKAVFAIDESRESAEGKPEEIEPATKEEAAPDTTLDTGLDFTASKTSLEENSAGATVDPQTEQSGLSFESTDQTMEDLLPIEEATTSVQLQQESGDAELSNTQQTEIKPVESNTNEEVVQVNKPGAGLTLEPIQAETEKTEEPVSTPGTVSAADSAVDADLPQAQSTALESKADVLSLEQMTDGANKSKVGAVQQSEKSAGTLALDTSSIASASEPEITQQNTGDTQSTGQTLELEPVIPSESASSEQSAASEKESPEKPPQDPPQAAQS